MNHDLTPEELDFFLQRLSVLGEKADKTGQRQIVRLVNFFHARAKQMQAEFRPQWRTAA